jgi:voltage-gated potassium channel Kch
MAKPRPSWRHAALLVSILALFIVTPVVAGFRHGILILNAAAAVVLASGSYALFERKRLFVIAVALSGISIITTGLLLLIEQDWAAILSHSCVIVLISFFSVTILGYVLRSGRITMDKIFAAICVYLLIGFAWTFAYALLDELNPGAFAGSSVVAAHDYVARVLQMRYFSFMTLTTVGYGDVVPESPAARTLAALEAITGQIYLAVLVARLVGLHIVHARDDASHDQ